MQHGMFSTSNDDVGAEFLNKISLHNRIFTGMRRTTNRSASARCGPCLLMAPEFEAAAKQLQGRVRFAKMDTDKESEMAGRLNIMGLPTLLFLDKLPTGQDSTGPAKAVLKERIEGAIRKDSIIALCEHHFFDGPRPDYV